MSKTMSSSGLNGKMKNQEEPNVRILRDMSHIPANKHCFDCGQRGPTYVNTTIGSFVCMTCSGLLRGLTPPHRVKSISMASFTSDEIELLKSKGNEYCRKVWLATCTPKDSHLGSDKDPDRLNLLRTFMSAKYEQKRFYVDPSKLSKSELNEIHAQTARALTSLSQNLPNSSISTMQKSPSLSSTRSSSSQQSNPSPLMNNLRNGNLQGPPQQNRLVNSITLPDIKPLTSLIGPSVPSLTSNQSNVNGTASDTSKASSTFTGVPNPISFINNLTPSVPQQQPVMKLNNHNNIMNFTPWAGDSNGVHNGGEDNNFDNSESFADFEDAFSRSNLNGSNNDFFAGQNQGQQHNNFNIKNSNGSGIGMPGINMLSGTSMQTPILPYNNNGGSPQPVSSLIPQNLPSSNGSEDKYAALKDLDSLFKQSSNGDAVVGNGTPVGNNTGPGLSSSTSLPANLSSSSGSTGWFSTSPNQNPFSQAPAPASQQISNGWNVNGVNGTGNGGVNPHNPFFGTTGGAWKSSPASNIASNHAVFSSGSSQPFISPAPLGQQPHQQIFPSAVSSNSGKPFNPFFAPASNPNNPFL